MLHARAATVALALALLPALASAREPAGAAEAGGGPPPANEAAPEAPGDELPRQEAGAVPPPVIELYTMGPGDELFSRFGHAAICVVDPETPRGRCYNYGTADFSTPLPLTLDFVRGRALFWVAVADLPRMIEAYRREDRSVWRQRLPLSPEQARAVSTALAASAREEVRYYRYHHFRDNCTTRIRDLLDTALGGVLHDGAHARLGPSFRSYAEQGFAGDLPLLTGTLLLLGGETDLATSRWEAMFLPDVLREVVADKLAARPEAVTTRKAPLATGSTALGRIGLGLLGLSLGGALFLLRGRPLAWRLALGGGGALLGVVALLVDVLASLSTLPELTRNEALLVLLPTDLLAGLLAGKWLRRYLELRLGTLVAVLAAWTAGLLVQPLLPLLLLAAPLLLAGRLSAPRRLL